MRFLFASLVIFSCAMAFGNNFSSQLDDSLKAREQNYDTLKYSYLPKHELYVLNYNPLNLLRIKEIGDFNMEFSWNRKTNKYFTIGAHHLYEQEIVDNTGLYNGFSYQYVHFRHMHHFFTRWDWLHYELDYGVLVGRHHHYYNLIGYRFNKEFYGAGMATAFELQFQVGHWGNISLRNDITYMLGRRTSSFASILDPDIIIDEFEEFWQLPTIWFLNVGVNFYL